MQKPRILIVDDEDRARKNLINFISPSYECDIEEAVGMGRLAISSRMAGMTVVYGQGETKMFDVIRMVSSELNPFGYLQGAVGLVTGVGFSQHTSY